MRADDRAARRSGRDPAICGGQEEARPPLGGRGSGWLVIASIGGCGGGAPPRPKFSYSGHLKRYRRGTAVFSLEVEEFCKSRNSHSDVLHIACLRAPSTRPSASPPRRSECAIGDRPVQCVIDVPQQFVAST